MPEDKEAIVEQQEQGGKQQKKLFGKKEKAPKAPKEKKAKKEKAPKEKKAKKEKAPKEKKPKKEKPPKAPKKPKPPKPPKKPKPPKEKKAKKEKAAKEPRERGGFPLLTVILVLLLLLLMGAIAGSIYFNFAFFPVRTELIDFLSALDPEQHTYTDTLKTREQAVTQAEAEAEQNFATREQELTAREEKVAAEEKRLNSRSAALDEREKKITQVEIETTPVYRGELTDEKLAELKNLGKIYSGMSADAVANILPQLYGAADMAAVLFYMDKNAASAVMELLNPELSAQITIEMLRE